MAAERSVDLESFEAYSLLIKDHIAGHSKEQLNEWLTKQLYIVLGNMLTVCAIEKVDCCPMEGFDKTAWDEILGLEKLGLQSVLACPIGYRSEDDHHQHMRKIRYPMSHLLIEM